MALALHLPILPCEPMTLLIHTHSRCLLVLDHHLESDTKHLVAINHCPVILIGQYLRFLTSLIHAILKQIILLGEMLQLGLGDIASSVRKLCEKMPNEPD